MSNYEDIAASIGRLCWLTRYDGQKPQNSKRERATMPSLKALEQMSLMATKRAWHNNAAWQEAKEVDQEVQSKIIKMKNERILVELKKRRET